MLHGTVRCTTRHFRWKEKRNMHCCTLSSKRLNLLFMLHRTVEARSEYWNVIVDEESESLTKLKTPFGRYCFERLPFGLVSAQDIFQRKLDQTLTGIICIGDDVIAYGQDDKTHDKSLTRMMERTKKRGLWTDKFHIKKNSISFYGHILTSEGIKPDPSKFSAIKDMMPP